VILSHPYLYWVGLIASGVTLGGVYALFTSGLTMILGAAQVMNFAQGEFFMIGGYILCLLTTTLGINYWLALPITTLAMGLIGAALSITIFARIVKSPRAIEIGMVLTLGLSLVLQQGATSLFGIEVRQPAFQLTSGYISIGGVSVGYLQLVSLGLAIVVLVALGVFLSKTRIGLAIKGTPQNRELAVVMGIPARRINIYAIALGTALSGLAAASIAPYYGVYPTMGSGFIYIGFAILFVGGLTDVKGTAALAVAIGIAASIGGGIISGTGASMAPLLIIAIAAIARPNGVFGAQGRLA
jgi:branched-chain amino acid transport system permease protein